MGFGDVRREIVARRDEGGERTDYRCSAHGCPNAGSLENHGPGTGVCYWHWREGDRSKWDAVTRKVRENFSEMRNWGERTEAQWAEIRAKRAAREKDTA